ncbi:MAG: alpha/beta hydrolase-fold protein [Vicinamibacterales bacterium]|jgi:enterochelin esterase family protein|nr:alpha/beta hydrolase-fold protein [Vicinamibacterales bacterium]MDP7479876.1 alpha/beta hydrolase-fold protein [Vicinamibacterales bacterium]HJN43056.1 alpha/beta hydrolase-fold protein [Vicinamibacterales bacterium]|tara:strand:- start:3380 stop:4531 length:1152 start_codon:yes stop_codon:yes gene_type:complete
MRTIAASVALLLVASSPLFAQGRGDRPAPVVSPEVTPDRMVTFRLRAPDAEKVTVIIAEIFRQVPGYDESWYTGRFSDDEVPLEKGPDGVWSLTLGPLVPDIYDYAYMVDGVRTLDPVNLDIKPGDAALENWLTVRGAEPLYSDQKPVPHGAVTTVDYESRSLGLVRHFNVYTPPGYETSGERYPVLYLLHGAGNSYATWVSAGAHHIMDNLVAEGSATPMIVVMPNGHVAAGANEVPADTPGGAFGADLLTDVMPRVEARFRTIEDREGRAIVGLSMGAGQTAALGFARLDLFSHIGLMSGAGLDREGRLRSYMPDARTANDKLRLFWIGRGEGENVEGARAHSQVLTDNGIEHVLHISRFGHSWITWRRDLYYEVGPKLFQ